MRPPTMALALALALLGGAVGTSFVALAQDGARGRGESEAPDLEDEEGDLEDVESADAEASIVVEGGEKVKVYRFSGLDISGRLKSPQLLYFLNRLRAEFDRPRLPHRSFVPELVRSTKSKAF